MAKTAWLWIALGSALVGCQPNEAMQICRKAERAGVLTNCRPFEGIKDGATQAVEANDVQAGGLARIVISTYGSAEWYENALRKKSGRNPVCLYGNAKKRVVVTGEAKAFEGLCRAVYKIVDADP